MESAATGSQGGAERMADCAISPLVIGGVSDLKLGKGSRFMYNLFQGVSACVLSQFWPCISMFFLRYLQ